MSEILVLALILLVMIYWHLSGNKSVHFWLSLIAVLSVYLVFKLFILFSRG